MTSPTTTHPHSTPLLPLRQSIQPILCLSSSLLLGVHSSGLTNQQRLSSQEQQQRFTLQNHCMCNRYQVQLCTEVLIQQSLPPHPLSFSPQSPHQHHYKAPKLSSPHINCLWCTHTAHLVMLQFIVLRSDHINHHAGKGVSWGDELQHVADVISPNCP